jgi:hypothetical protein
MIKQSILLLFAAVYGYALSRGVDELHKSMNTLRMEEICFKDFLSYSLFTTGDWNIRLSFSMGGSLIIFLDADFYNLELSFLG